MARLVSLTGLAMIWAATAAPAGEYGGPYRGGPAASGPVLVIDGYPGAIDPLARGAIYNTPPAVSFTSGHHRRRYHRRRGVVLHARF